MKPVSILRTAFRSVLLLVEVVVGAVIVFVRTFGVVRGMALNARHVFGITCPAGHAFASEGTWTCQSCKYTYEGSVWLCAFCRASTAHHPCPTCGLSIASPFRFGGPS